VQLLLKSLETSRSGLLMILYHMMKVAIADGAYQSSLPCRSCGRDKGAFQLTWVYAGAPAVI
jgi:hypothetical protein